MSTFSQPNLMHARYSSRFQITTNFIPHEVELVHAIVGEHNKIYEIGCVSRQCNFGVVNVVNELQLQNNHYVRSNRVYAAKFININEYLRRGQDVAENFLSEVACYQYIASLGGHPNIMPLIDALILPDWYVAIMEYATGGDLLSRVQNDGTISPIHLPRYVNMICSALSFLHQHNICHRDLSTENLVVFKESDSIKLVDFGMSFRYPDVGLYPAPAVIFGKLYYLAPELLRRIDFLPPAVDMWAVGIICFVCLVYRFPLPDYEVLQRIPITDALLEAWMQVKLEKINVILPPVVQSFILSLLREVPSERLTAQQALEHAWLRN